MTMSESKYFDVVLNLRNTGVNAMKSYYANTFNSSLEKHRSDHSEQHYKAAYEKYTHSVQSPPKSRKYDGPYHPPLDSRKAMLCEPVFRSYSEKYRLPLESKLSGYPGYPPVSPTERSRVHDIHNISSYTHKLSQYCRDKVPVAAYETNCKRTYDSISSPPEEFDVKHPRPHHPVEHRFKYSAFRSERSYHPFYPPPKGGDIEKPYPTHGHHRSGDAYDQYRPLPGPCALPCCSSLNYSLKGEGHPLPHRPYYGRRSDSLSPTYSPSYLKKPSDYSSTEQVLTSREPGESSAFSPIRPSHIRRVHSTESGYSSESTSCHSCTTEGSCKNPKCCAMLDLNSPTRGGGGHNSSGVCRDLSSQINGESSGDRPIGNVRETSPAAEPRDRLAPETSLHYPHSNEDGGRASSGPVKREEVYRDRRLSSQSYHEAVWREHVNNKEKGHHREMFNLEKIRRTYSLDEDFDVRRSGVMMNDVEKKRWNSVSDFNVFKDNRAATAATAQQDHQQPNESKLEISDEASRAAMQAFDAHVRKMIARTTGDHDHAKLPPSPIHSQKDEKLSNKNNNDDHQNNENINKSIKTEHSTEKPIPKAFSIKHSISELCGEKASEEESDVRDKYPTDDVRITAANVDDGKKALLELSKNGLSNDEKDDKLSPEERKSKCDSTEKAVSECDDKKEIKLEEKQAKTDKTKNDGDYVKCEKAEIQSPQPEVQCPAVDSTLNDETASPPPATGEGLLGLARVANEHLGQALAKEKKRSKNNNCLHLWQFLRRMLDQEQDKVGRCIEWTNRETGEFRLIKTAVVADLWGQSKNRTCMTYEKMARAMRYYYKMNILEKVPHKRLHFRFGERILTKVLHPTTGAKPFPLGKAKIFDDMYLNKRNLNTNYSNAAPPGSAGMMKTNPAIVSDYRNSHRNIGTSEMKYLQQIQQQAAHERSKNTIPYLPNELPVGVSLPLFYNEHSSNLHHTLPPRLNGGHTNRMTEIPPRGGGVEHLRKRSPELNNNNLPPCSIARKFIPPPVALNTTSPGSNPSVSPYSGGEETPERWSDVDSNDELVVDTDSE